MTKTILDSLYRSIEARESVALVTVIRCSQPDRIGAKAVVWLDRPALGSLSLGELELAVLTDAEQVLRGRQHRILRYPERGLDVFVEVQFRPPHLFIVGAGHIAVPLADLASLCDFTVTVIDDRLQFANRERFPKADKVIAEDIQKTVRDTAMDEDSFVVLVTRGHSLDVTCLLEIIDRPLAYIGMIGSRRRVNAVFDLLDREGGIPREKLNRVYSPIGLPIGGRTPAEIAVSIMAEIINVRRGGKSPSISDARRLG